MMNTGSALPMPKMNSASGIHAMPEIGRSISTTGSTSVVERAVQAHQRGRAEPRARCAIARLTSIRPRLIAACSKARGRARAPTTASAAASGDGSRTGCPSTSRPADQTSGEHRHRAQVDARAPAQTASRALAARRASVPRARIADPSGCMLFLAVARRDASVARCAESVRAYDVTANIRRGKPPAPRARDALAATPRSHDRTPVTARTPPRRALLPTSRNARAACRR